MSTRALALVAAISLVHVGFSVGQTQVVDLNGVRYIWPASQGDADDVLTAADGTGALGWSAAAASADWPAGLVVFAPSGSCPPGWTEYTALRGRAVVGLVSGGTSEATVGTALTNLENRSVGQHTHSVTDPGHTHAQSAHTHGLTDPGHAHTAASGTTTVSLATGDDGIDVYIGNSVTDSATTSVSIPSTTATNQSAATGITLANAGSVAGTNAPYLQLIACQTPES